MVNSRPFSAPSAVNKKVNQNPTLRKPHKHQGKRKNKKMTNHKSASLSIALHTHTTISASQQTQRCKGNHLLLADNMQDPMRNSKLEVKNHLYLLTCYWINYSKTTTIISAYVHCSTDFSICLRITVKMPSHRHKYNRSQKLNLQSNTSNQAK